MISRMLNHILGITLESAEQDKGSRVFTCRIHGVYHGKWYSHEADRGCFVCKPECKFGKDWLDECPAARTQLLPIWHDVFSELLLT